MNDSVSSSTLTGNLLDIFNRNTGILEKNSGELLNMQRAKAFHDFDKLGIPTVKNENYKYTPLEKYFSGSYDVDFEANPFRVDIKSIFKCDVPELDTHVILMLNGFYSFNELHGQLPQGVIICGLNEASVKYPELFRKHYARYADTSMDGLVALNTLFAYDGVFIYIPENTVVEKPLQIVNLSFSVKNLRITRRNLIIADNNSSVNIVVCDHTLSSHSFLANSLTEIYTGRNVQMSYDRLQNENS